MATRSGFTPLLLIASAIASSASPGANYNLPLDRPYTLRNADPMALERELGRQIGSEGAMSFIFPRPCASRLDSSRVCGEPVGIGYSDPAQGRQLSVSPLFAFEHRRSRESVEAFEGGGTASGASGPISFYLDARMFTELHEDPGHPSYDREFVERQDEAASGSISYSSYSRYRSNLSADFAWGRVTVARDAAHWGPGLLANLAFNQDALPFNQLSWTSHLGPLSVITLYGQLAIHGDSLGSFDGSGETRSLYAHRYELRASPDLLLGVSEQLFLYEREEPFAFAPVVPLFIFKGSGLEISNNGNISADAAWRIANRLLAYSEFFIDDIQSPTSLFDDNWANKWAWMAGIHAILDLPSGKAGLVAEYSRVEPWVYTHYIPATAQAANGGHPIGNPRGPNSQWLAVRPYFRGAGGWYASAQADMVWKGRDPGSRIDDVQPTRKGSKAFIEGIGGPDIRVSPSLAMAWKTLRLEAQAGIGKDPDMRVRIHWER